MVGWLGLGERRKKTGGKLELITGIKSPIIDVKIGSNHVLALTVSGEVYAWGDNKFGQIGIRNTIKNTK